MAAHMKRAGISVAVVAVAPRGMEWRPRALYTTTASVADMLAAMGVLQPPVRSEGDAAEGDVADDLRGR